MVRGLSIFTSSFLPGVPVAVTPLSFPSFSVELEEEFELVELSEDEEEELESPQALSERHRAALTALAPRIERILRCFFIFIHLSVVGVPEELLGSPRNHRIFSL
jgi:hypothetical protein